ncbi:MAG: outer membrane beta-barrel protein [Desulfobacteraceae bacterium]|nr:outer membrane beta-barrel protein [Desulfobacteraceae bacterium]
MVIDDSLLAGERILIKAHIETGYQKNTNFYKSNINTKSVDTHNLKSGIKLGYTTAKSTVSLDYWFNILRYNDQNQVPAGQIKANAFDYTEQMTAFTAQSQISDRLLVRLDNLHWKTRDPAKADINSNEVDRFKYSINKFTPTINYTFGEKFIIGLKYTNLYTNYFDDGAGQGEDSTENRKTSTLWYNFNQKSSFNLDYQHWTRDYDKTTSNYTSNQTMVNVYHQFNYFKFSAGAGYHTRDFDQTISGGNIDKFIWELSLTARNPSYSIKPPKSRIFIGLGSNLNDSSSGGIYYTASWLKAKFTYLILEKINCQVTTYYQTADYETSTRKDDRWLISGGADYLITDFFTLRLVGGIEDRDSNQASKDFTNKFVILKLSYKLGSK